MFGQMEEEKVTIKKGSFVRKSHVCVLLVVFLILVVVVGILSGMLSANKAREDTKIKYEKQIAEMGNNQQSTTTSVKLTTKKEDVETTTTLPSTTTPSSCSDEWCNVRLPLNIVPYHYDLNIQSYPEQLRYNGSITMSFNVKAPTKLIMVHTTDTKIVDEGTEVNSYDSLSSLSIKRNFMYPENDYYVVVLTKEMDIGNYSLKLEFQSNVSKTLTGFYKSSYTQDNKTNVLLTTKFQPTDARKAFPCFDEPNLKATYNITMTYPDNYHARSNMPMISSKSTKVGWTTRVFEKTVKMSSYLICFVVSKFEKKFEGNTGRNKNIKLAIWTRPEFVGSTEYAYNTSDKMMTFLESFLGVDYPMPKLDMVGIPDYGSGATEHWGIITYRESRLLYTPGVSSYSNQRSTAAIISHECAHLWFGNLVTCKWWNDLWVQEGMASYLEYYAQDYAHPEWKMMEDFLSVDWSIGMALDSLASSHPISQPVDHPKRIREIFDSITYNKGSSLFRMLDIYLGKEKFKEGLKKYLTTHQYKGATVDDLWTAFTNTSGEDINSIMDTWTHQMGFPLVTITNKGGNKFLLTQKHFLIDQEVVVTRPSKYNYMWKIPFLYVTSNDLSNTTKMVLEKKAESIDSNANYIIGNYNHGGFYRVNYDDDTWNKIVDQMEKNFTVFTTLDRAGILDDAFKLARANYIAYSIPLRLLTALEDDTSSLTWSFVYDNLEYIDKVLSSQEIYSQFRAYMRRSYGRFLQPGKKVSYLRSGCKVGQKYAVEYTNGLFQSWMLNGTNVDGDIRSTVYYCGVMNGGDEEWQFVYDKFMKSNDPAERSKLQSALSASQKPWIINKWLEYSLDATKVRTQDTVSVIGAVAANNPVGKYIAWNFAVDNWLKIMDIAEENNFHVAQVTSRLTSQFTTRFDLEQVEAMWKRYPEAGAGANARKQGIEKIKTDILWLEKNYDAIKKWIKVSLE